MKMLFIILTLLFSSNAYAKTTPPFPKKTSQQIKELKQKIKNPSIALKIMGRFKNKWSLFKIMKKHMTSEDYKYLKSQGDLLSVQYKDPLNINILSKNRFKFSNHSEPFILSHSGNHLKFKNQIFQLDKRKSLMWNYQTIQKKLSSAYKSHIFSLIPRAYAKDSSVGFDIITLLYYMKVYYDGSGIMWDMFAEEPDVLKSIESLNKQGKNITNMNCDSLGMVMEYSDGSKSYLTWDSNVGRLSEADNSSNYERVIELSDMNQAMAGQAQMYYCSMLQAEGQSNIVNTMNLNFINSNPEEDHISR